MSDNQRNTTTNESDSDTAGTAAVGDMETDERDTVGAGAAEAPETDSADSVGDAGASGAGDSETPESEGVGEIAGPAKAPASAETDTDSDTAAEDDDVATGTGTATGAAADTDVEPEPVASAAAEEPVVPATAAAPFRSTEPSEEKTVAEDRAEAGGTPVTETKASVPEGPSAVKASLSSRKAHLTVSRVEPWSVMKFSFVVSLVCFIVLFVAIAVIYATLSMLGVFDELTSMIDALLEGDGGDGELGLNPAAWFSPGRVLGYTGVVGALNIVLITALSTVGAMVYNLVADLVGGVDVTLSEAE